jgi:integrase
MAERVIGRIFKRKVRKKMPGDPKGVRTGPEKEMPHWTWRIRVGDKEYEECTYTTDRRKAERILAQKVAEMCSGTFVPPTANRVTFDELAQDYINYYKTNDLRSLRRAETSKKNLEQEFGGCRAAVITTARIREYIALRQNQGVANATIRAELMALSKMFSLAVENGRVPRAPKIPRLKVAGPRRGFFEEKMFRAVLAKLIDYLRPAIEFCYITGWRVQSEVLPLRWDQVDFERGTVRLWTSKNRERRLFPFSAHPRLAELLKAQRESTERLQKQEGRIIPFVFHRNGREIKTYRRPWAKACERAGHPGMLVHDLRRTAVRNLVRAGVPDKIAMELTGHKTRAVFDRYNIVDDQDLRAAVKLLAGQSEALESRGTPGGHKASGGS